MVRVLSNKIRIVIGKFNYQLFEPFWIFYYKYVSCCAPKKHYYKKWIENPECGEWDYLHYGEFYDPICFPLPFKINCVGCHGCATVHSPLLMPNKPKGPWKVFTTETFNQQYAELCGETALIDLLFDLEKHNEKVDDGKKV